MSTRADEQREAGLVCEVCGAPPRKRALHRDHDHKTGKERGLLCFVDNHYILGKYATAERLRAAADYLDRYDPDVPDPISYEEALARIRRYGEIMASVGAERDLQLPVTGWAEACKAYLERYAD